MFVKQISVFLENSPGKLAEFTKLLADNNIDLLSLAIADTMNFGILRCVVADFEYAFKIISANGYTAKITDVIAASVEDKPGGLAYVAKLFYDNDISVEYLYSSIRNTSNNALIVFRVDKPQQAYQVLKNNNIETYNQDNFKSMDINKVN